MRGNFAGVFSTEGEGCMIQVHEIQYFFEISPAPTELTKLHQAQNPTQLSLRLSSAIGQNSGLHPWHRNMSQNV